MTFHNERGLLCQAIPPPLVSLFSPFLTRLRPSVADAITSTPSRFRNALCLHVKRCPKPYGVSEAAFELW